MLNHLWRQKILAPTEKTLIMNNFSSYRKNSYYEQGVNGHLFFPGELRESPGPSYKKLLL